jgi:hypothetical protein
MKRTVFQLTASLLLVPLLAAAQSNLTPHLPPIRPRPLPATSAEPDHTARNAAIGASATAVSTLVVRQLAKWHQRKLRTVKK